MEKIHKYQEVVVLSDKKPENIKENMVEFVDGSVANLDALTFLNKGKGEIKFVFEDEELKNLNIKKFEFESKNNIFLNGKFDFDIIKSENKFNIDAIGTNSFLSSLKITENNEDIVITLDNPQSGPSWVNGRRVKGSPHGKITIHVPNEPSIYTTSQGNGSGNIDIKVKKLEALIHGEFILMCKSVSNADIKIQGEGKVSIEKITSSCRIFTQGPGNVKINSGQINEFNAITQGPGKIEANIETNKAELILEGDGEIFVKKVKKQSLEQHQGPGNIKVGSRGND